MPAIEQSKSVPVKVTVGDCCWFATVRLSDVRSGRALFTVKALVATKDCPSEFVTVTFRAPSAAAFCTVIVTGIELVGPDSISVPLGPLTSPKDSLRVVTTEIRGALSALEPLLTQPPRPAMRSAGMGRPLPLCTTAQRPSTMPVKMGSVENLFAGREPLLIIFVLAAVACAVAVWRLKRRSEQLYRTLTIEAGMSYHREPL